MTVTAKRAIRAFAVAADPWPSVDRWAGSQGYRVVEQDGNRRVYRKGTGFLVAARKVEVTAADGGLRVEAYVAANVVARAFALFLIPSEITVEPGGVKAVIPRNMGRTEVNALLQELGQAPIA
jgi:hypothetical protein